MSRSLLLKGLVGVGVVAGAGSLVVFREKIFGVGEEDLSEFKHKELIEKVGLNCGLEEGVDEVTETKDCTVKDNGTINVEVEGKKEEGVSFTTNGSKLKVSKSENKDYSGGLRFVVDSGDLALTKDGGALTHFQKLEQFETYEVKKVRDKFYLKRKKEAKEGKKDALGLPTGKDKCSLPDTGTSECSITTEEIGKVKFQGHDGGVEVSSGTVTLKVSKSGDTTTFTDGYRFTFTFPKEITINSKSLKANTPYDFKIKKHENSNTLTLERAWTDDNTFTKKAGLDCSNTNACTVSSAEPKLNVRVGDKKKEGITTTTGGKIKMEKEQEGYNQGLKFSITTGDVTLTGGTGDDISKLEELETYEITEEGGKFYLSIKTSKKDAIESSLSIPEKCFKTLNSACSLDAESFKKINFDGKSNPTSSGNITLTISEADSTDFPLGYRFTLQSNQDITIKSNTNVVKANIPTDFKIKKKGKNNGLSLEKAWTADSLAKKVGLQSCNSSNVCTIQNSGSKLKVKQVNKNESVLKEKSLTKSSGNGKIKVTKDQVGYNQGFKFEISDASINLNGSTAAEESEKITNLGEFETYEIKEEGNDGWFLVRKTKADDFIKKGLNIGSICTGSFPETTSALETCNIEDPDKLKEINFENKGSFKTWPTTKNIQLEINKDTTLPGGFKFTFNSCDNASTCLPGSSSAKTDSSGGLIYQIKKGKGTNLSLMPMPKNSH